LIFLHSFRPFFALALSRAHSFTFGCFFVLFFLNDQERR
jgi:hypothetical protein